MALDQEDKKPVQGAYDSFPFNADLKLFLAFQRRNKAVEYFSDYNEWLTLIYALVNVYSQTFSERLLYWFEALSQLSSRYDQEQNTEIFEGILQREISNETGLEYILYKLNGEQTVNSRFQYMVQELESYFRNLGSYHLSNFMYSNVIYINRYLSEIKDQLSLHHNLVIESPPNSGKSTLFLEYFDGKIIFVVPSLILLEDLRKKVRPEKLQVIAQGVRAEDIDPSKSVILSTYEGLEKILRAGLDLKSYTFVMDEAHQLFNAAAPFFRFKTMRRIIKSLSRFKNFIFISGTWIPFPFTNLPFTFIKVRYKKPVTTRLEIISTPTPLDTLTVDVVRENGKQVVLINNRKENEILKDKLRTLRPGTPVSIFNRDTKEDDEVKDILNINHLQEGEVMVGTQMIAEGISLLDPDIAALRFYRLMLPEMTVQFSNRTRAYGSKPTICFYIKREKFFLTGFDYELVYQSIYNKQRGFTPANTDMAREYIDLEQQLMIYYTLETKSKKGQKVYAAHIREKGTDRLDPLLLGYQTLQRLEGLMNLDLFSVLYRLKDLGYEFAFSSREGTQIRKHFKDLRLAEHIYIIKDDLDSILHEQYTLKSFLPGTPLAKAWALLQVVDLEYFLKMDENYRTELFSSKKIFNDFIERLVGIMILKDKVHSLLYDFLGKDFKKRDALVLSRIAHVDGFPKKIYHQDLMAEFKNLDASVQKIKSILKRQFTVSKAKAGSSQKYFGLDKIHHDVTQYIRWDKLEGFTGNPFIDY